jgi:Ulp1 family protease
VAPADTQHLLTFATLLNDNIVQGYMNLFAAKFDRLGIPVRIVMPQFYPAFLRQGWAGVQRWLGQRNWVHGKQLADSTDYSCANLYGSYLMRTLVGVHY